MEGKQNEKSRRKKTKIEIRWRNYSNIRRKGNIVEKSKIDALKQKNIEKVDIDYNFDKIKYKNLKF